MKKRYLLEAVSNCNKMYNIDMVYRSLEDVNEAHQALNEDEYSYIHVTVLVEEIKPLHVVDVESSLSNAYNIRKSFVSEVKANKVFSEFKRELTDLGIWKSVTITNISTGTKVIATQKQQQ